MKWFIRRLLISCASLSIVCAAIVVLGRLDHTQTRVQTLGFDICDGEPCFRGIKVGTDWITVQKMFSNEASSKYSIALKIDGTNRVDVLPSRDGSVVDDISISTDPDHGSLPIDAADIVRTYGAPCRVSVDWFPQERNYLSFIYPKMIVRLNVKMKNSYSQDEPFNMDSAAWGITVSPENYLGTCNDVTSNVGPWHGFVSIEEYRQRNRRNMGAAQPVAIP